jgi:hypothetical protein
MSKTLDNIGSYQLTVTPVAVPAKAEIRPVLPEFIRIPSKGLCPWTGLSRAKIYQLMSEGKLRTVCLRKRGATRGTRLIHLQSLLDYLKAQMEGGERRAPRQRRSRCEERPPQTLPC